MKQMTEVWTQYKNKKITAEEAIKRLNVLCADASGPDCAKAMGMYQKILDEMMPETKPDTELEKQWSREMYGDEDGQE